MGFLHDLYMLMEEGFPAMEAEDITGQVNDQAADLAGGADNQGSQNDRDLSLDTDDILGTKSDPNGGTPGEDNNNPDDTDDSTQDDDMSTDGDNPDQQGDSVPDEPPSDDPAKDAMDNQDDPFSVSRKKKLWGNYKALYLSLDDAVDLISKYVPNISDAATIKTLDNIKDNLMDAKDLAYKTLTEEYKAMEYPEMEKRYIGLNHIFDLCTKELETYFDKYRND
jgi:hypothetical protein